MSIKSCFSILKSITKWKNNWFQAQINTSVTQSNPKNVHATIAAGSDITQPMSVLEITNKLISLKSLTVFSIKKNCVEVDNYESLIVEIHSKDQETFQLEQSFISSITYQRDVNTFSLTLLLFAFDLTWSNREKKMILFF